MSISTSHAQTSVDDTYNLTPRERDVLACLVDGRSYKQVADQLGISIETVRTHIKRLYRKLGVHCVAEAVVRALRENII